MNKQVLYQVLYSVSVSMLVSSFISVNAAGTAQEGRDGELASKGALTEATFIIHNKAYEIKNMHAQIKRELEQSHMQGKRLEQEKTLLEAAVARYKKLLQETKEQKAQEHIRQELEQSKTVFLMHMSLMHANEFMQKIYAELAKISADYNNYVEAKSVELVDAQISYRAMRAEVTKSQEIKRLLIAQQECVHKALDLFQQEIKVNVEKQRLRTVQRLLSVVSIQALRTQLLTEEAQLNRTLAQAQKQIEQKRKQLIACKKTVQRLSDQLIKMGFEQAKNHQFLSMLTALRKKINKII